MTEDVLAPEPVERTVVTIELAVDHTAGLELADVAGYALEGARLALAGTGLPTPWEDAAGAPIRAHAAEVRLTAARAAGAGF